MGEARAGDKNPMFGKKHTAETLALLSQAKIGENNPMFGRTGKNHPFFGKIHSAETIASLGTTIFVYLEGDGTLVNTFLLTRKATEFFNCSNVTIFNYIKNGKLFKGKWKLSTTKKSF
jgi:group I intron endonuclease